MWPAIEVWIVGHTLQLSGLLIPTMSVKNVIKYMLTDRCNGNCSYCPTKDRLFNKDMSFEDIALSFHKVWPRFDNGTTGFDFIHLFGGECSLRMDLINEIDRRINERFVQKNEAKPCYILSTNLIQLKADLLDFILAHRNNILLVISVDGTQELHNVFRQGNTFNKIIKNVETLKNNGVGIFNVTAVYHLQIFKRGFSPYDIAGEITSLIDPTTILFNKIISSDEKLIIEDDFFYDQMLNSYHDACLGIKSNDLKKRKIAQTFVQMDFLKMSLSQKYFCDYGVNSISIFPGGSVDICPDILSWDIQPGSNLYANDFDHKLNMIRDSAKTNLDIDSHPICSKCSARSICHNCPYWTDARKLAQCAFARKKSKILNEIQRLDPEVFHVDYVGHN